MRLNTIQTNDVLLRDPARGCWLLFRRPVHILVANCAEEVIPVLQQLDRSVNNLGLYAAGFIAYEAAPGFDPALSAKPASTFPLVWFGLYEKPEVLSKSPIALTDQPGGPFPTWSASITRQEYDAAIANVKAAIAKGETYQVNYTYRLAASFDTDPLAFFYELVRAQNAPYAALIDTGSFMLCSASPELFFSLDGALITSRPMKGTASRGRTLQEDLEQRSWLRHSAKNQAENVMIVDMVRNDIGRIARIGSVQVPELYTVEKFPTVWQMVSTVIGETDAELSEIFSALFPPASITGAPKVRTMEIIEDLETSARHIYTGCIGFISPERKAQFNVAIRTVLIDKSTCRAEYGTGGGITWDSVDAAEFEECQTKAKILTTRIPHFSLLESILWSPEGGFFLLEYHLKRLEDSANYFSFPVDLRAVRTHLAGLAGSLGAHSVKVRLLINEDGKITTQVENLPPPDEKRPLRACLAPAPIDSADPFLYHKTTHRQIYERARQSCPPDQAGPWDEVILWNENGEITEACSANIIVEIDGELVTPPVACGLLPGTYRAWLLEQGKIKEKVIRLEDLSRVSRLYLINSVRKQRLARLCLPVSLEG